MKAAKTLEKVLGCSLDAAAAELVQFWKQQEFPAIYTLLLRSVEGPPVRREYRILELLTNVECPHDPKCPVDYEEHRRADLTLTVHRWDPECTKLAMQIYPPSPNADGEYWPGKGCYPPMPERMLENISDQFATYLEHEGITPSGNGEELTAGSLPKGFPRTPQARDRWKRSYQVILKTREEYKKRYDDLDTDDPNPSNNDLRDALARMPEWNKKPSDSTVRRIRQAGDSGMLA